MQRLAAGSTGIPAGKDMDRWKMRKPRRARILSESFGERLGGLLVIGRGGVEEGVFSVMAIETGSDMLGR